MAHASQAAGRRFVENDVMFQSSGFRNSTGGNRLFQIELRRWSLHCFHGIGSAEGKPRLDKTLKRATIPRVQPFFSENGTVLVNHAAGSLPFDTGTVALVRGLNPQFVVRRISGQRPGRMGVA